jgi:hypothetical protein
VSVASVESVGPPLLASSSSTSTPQLFTGLQNADDTALGEPGKIEENALAQDPLVDEVVSSTKESAQEVDKELISDFLLQWASYWSSKDFQAYANFYGEEFSNHKFSSLEDWLAFRKPRILGKQFIEVSVQLLDIKPLEDGRIETRLIQNYAGNNLRVRSLKRLILDVTGSVPKIIWEGNA